MLYFLGLMNSLKNPMNHLMYRDTFCCISQDWWIYSKIQWITWCTGTPFVVFFRIDEFTQKSNESLDVHGHLLLYFLGLMNLFKNSVNHLTYRYTFCCCSVENNPPLNVRYSLFTLVLGRVGLGFTRNNFWIFHLTF